jgi:hypothetical protein
LATSLQLEKYLFKYIIPFCDLYYKLMTMVNDNSRVVNKLEASLIDDARVIIYDRHMFIVQATGGYNRGWTITLYLGVVRRVFYHCAEAVGH